MSNKFENLGSERIAVLEERTENHGEQIKDLVNAINALTREVTSINQRFQRNMGFLGGMAFTFSMIGASIGTFGSEVFKRLFNIH